MSIILYTGFVGSGKSFCATKIGTQIADALLGNRKVIANFPIKPKRKMFSFLRKEKYNNPSWIYKKNDDLTVEYLISFYNDWIEKNGDVSEGQFLLIFDEASIPFNSRSYSDKSRLGWIQFLTQSRKFGFDVIFITQDAGMIDRQIRALCEYEYVHRKLNNMFALSWLSLFRVSVFGQLRYWNGTNSRYTKAQMRIFIFKKSIAERYDTMRMFDLDE